MKISIITCTYNSAPYLRNNILSVKEQNYRNFEHIFIDGFSTDETLKIITEYQKEFPDQIKIFQSKPEGISKAMNQGIRESSGEYLIHLHSDDSLFDKNVLIDCSKFLINKNYPDWIYGKINTITKKEIRGTFPNKRIWHKKEHDFIKNYLLKFFNFIPHQAVFIKKNVFNSFGYFDTDLKTAMDYAFWLHIRKQTKWIFFDRIISNYTLREDAQSSSEKNKIYNEKETLSVLKKYLNPFEFIILFFLKKVLYFKKSNYQK